MSPAAEPATAAPCPTCGSALTDDPRFVRWCRSCGWNAHTTATAAKGRGDRLQRRFNRATEERLFRRVTESGTRRSSIGGAYVAAYALSGLVHLVTLALAGYAGYTLTLPYWPMRGLGVALLAITYLLRPRFGPSRKALRRRHVLDDAAAPELRALAARVAAELGTAAPDLIAVDGDYNASYSRIGIRRRVLLTLGLPLWETLGPAERVALLGHELGHGANGDSRSGLWIGSALGTLEEWYRMLRPDRSVRRVNSRAGASSMVLASEKLAQVVLGVFAELVLLVHRLLGRLTALSGRRAEYRADELATRVAGTEATADLLQALTLGDSAAHVYQRHARLARAARLTRGGSAAGEPQQADLWAELRAYVASVPESERARRLLVSQLDDSAVDTAHPPTHLRLDFVRQLAAAGPAIVLTPAESAAIDAELTDARAAVARELG